MSRGIRQTTASAGCGNADENCSEVGFYAGAGLTYSHLLIEDDAAVFYLRAYMSF